MPYDPDKPPAVVRSDWKRPSPPIGKEKWWLEAILDFDSWGLYWTDGDDYVEVTIEAAWPFVGDYAMSDDWEALGIETAFA